MRRLSVMAPLLLSCALATPSCTKLGLFHRAESPPALAMGPAIGSPAPEIEGEDFDGRPLKLSDYRGKVVVLSFWTSW